MNSTGKEAGLSQVYRDLLGRMRWFEERWPRAREIGVHVGAIRGRTFESELRFVVRCCRALAARGLAAVLDGDSRVMLTPLGRELAEGGAA